MEQRKESIESIIKRAPKGATHYMYPEEHGVKGVFFKIDEDMIVESAWVVESLGSIVGFEEDCGYCRFDYEEGDMQPYVRWESLVELTKKDGKTGGKWIPEVGELVWFKRRDSIDFAYDVPLLVKVVAVVNDLLWVDGERGHMIANLRDIYPVEKKKSLREELIDIMSCGGRWNFVDVDHAADRLIEAGIKL